MSLFNFEIILILTSFEKCVLSNDTKATAFTVTDANLLQQLDSNFKRTINWTKYQSKISKHSPKSYLGFLIDTSFQKKNRFCVLSFENKDDIEQYTQNNIFHLRNKRL